MSKEHESGEEAMRAAPPHHVLPVSSAGSFLADDAESELRASTDEVRSEARNAPERYTVETADLDRAFWLLRKAVTQLNERGARATAAGVKSEVLRLTDAAFRESDLGFTSFRSFLESAEEAGVVTLVLPAPGSGLDVTVFVDASLAANSPVRRLGRPSRRRIRPDLWTAFVDWNQKFVRLWDRSAERAVIFPAAPSVGEPAAIGRLRDRYANQPEGFVVIQPISQEQQLVWMRSFAESVSSEAPDLQRCLEEPRPAASFARTLRGDPALGEAWRSRLSSLVYSVIETWATQNDLHIDPREAPFGPGQLATSTAPRQPRRLSAREFAEQDQAEPSSRPRETDLRTQLLAVLSELSTDELMQIRVPIVYALRP
ncbi:hypothetical protein [Streptomyces nigra]|uniref:hypothetical protein n=1 Tax=Streptomyces nigra TaxID=1827580 RepID=UPI00380B3B51